MDMENILNDGLKIMNLSSDPPNFFENTQISARFAVSLGG